MERNVKGNLCFFRSIMTTEEGPGRVIFSSSLAYLHALESGGANWSKCVHSYRCGTQCVSVFPPPLSFTPSTACT